MKCAATHYTELREYLETVPLVDCHDHTGPECGPKYTDPMQIVVSDYYLSDCISTSSLAEYNTICDTSLPLEERWPLLEKVWKRACHTGYAQVARRVLKRFYGVDELTLDALKGIADKLPDLTDEKVFDSLLAEANIVVRLEDAWVLVPNNVVVGAFELSPRGRAVISLPQFHDIRSFAGVQAKAAAVNRHVTSLDEYLDVCRTIFESNKKFGAVAFKDQSAYTRNLHYDNPSRAEAEKVFNWFMEDPRRSAAYPDGIKPLDDYLFHEFMRIARNMDLPVQIHTGHIAGNYNDVAKANAAGLVKLIELHQKVRFDLFHANWPYAGDLLFLAKNYPNVAIDFCWTHMIDPVYSQRMLKQALSSVPHWKIHGYGSDLLGSADRAWAHASIARDNVAIALSEMVDMDYLGLQDAKEVGYAWFFANPNEYFRLGL